MLGRKLPEEPSLQALGAEEECEELFLCMDMFLCLEETLTPLEGLAKSAKTAFFLGVVKMGEAEVMSCWTGERLRDKALVALEADP
jgi:hypothetical protein